MKSNRGNNQTTIGADASSNYTQYQSDLSVSSRTLGSTNAQDSQQQRDKDRQEQRELRRRQARVAADRDLTRHEREVRDEKERQASLVCGLNDKKAIWRDDEVNGTIQDDRTEPE